MVSLRQLRQPRVFVGTQQGFTLVEVMVSSMIFLIVMMGGIGSMLLAMRMTLETRYQDRAMTALKSIADQFQNSPITDRSTSATKILFTSTNGVETGYGMAWDTVKQTFTYPPASASATIIVGTPAAAPVDVGSLIIPLGSVDASGTAADDAITCTITREVSAVADSAVTTTYGGTLVEGVFRARYTIMNKQKTLSIRVLRNLNPSDS